MTDIVSKPDKDCLLYRDELFVRNVAEKLPDS